MSSVATTDHMPSSRLSLVAKVSESMQSLAQLPSVVVGFVGDGALARKTAVHHLAYRRALCGRRISTGARLHATRRTDSQRFSW